MKNILYLYVTRLNACPGNQPQCYCPIQCLVRKKKKKLWHKCKKMATLQVRCWYRRHVELLRRRWRDVWREDRSVNETDETRQREKSEQVDIGSLEPWSGISPSRARIAPFGTSVDPGTHWTKPDLWPDSDTGLNPPPPLQHLGQEEVRYEKYEGVKGQIQCDFSLSGLYFDCFVLVAAVWSWTVSN